MIILFDFDGTLARTIELQLGIALKLLIKKGYKIKEQEKEKLLNAFKNEGPAAALKALNFPTAEYPRLLAEIKEEQKARMNEIPLLPGLTGILTELKNASDLGILSSGYGNYINPFLANNNIANFFKYVYSDDSLQGKQKLILRFLTDTGIKPNEVCYVGDETEDMTLAKKAGFKTAAVTWGANSKEVLKQTDPDFIFDSPGELLDLLAVV